MLGFLIFLGWVVVFSSPLIFSIIDAIREREVSKGRWWFSGIWACFGGGLIIFSLWLLSLWTEVLWFEELNQAARFWTVFWAKWKYFFYGFFVFYIFFSVNVRLNRIGYPKKEFKENFPWFTPTFLGGGILAAVFFGLATSDSWRTFLLYQNQVPFGITDPIFGEDVGFYVFSLPFYKFLRNFSIWVLFLTFVGVIISYGAQASNAMSEVKKKIVFRFITHTSILGIFAMAVFIFASQIAIWNLMYSSRGAVFGAGWTDVHVQVGAYKFFIGALIVSAVLLGVSALARSIKVTKWAACIGFGVCVLVWLIGVIIYPALIQHFKVSPNELAMETEYIKHNIKFTRIAYKLTDEQVKQMDFPVNMEISSDILKNDKVTLDNVRLWDWRVLESTNHQNQAFRLYYTFPDVDVVRYKINGKLTQLMFSMRELDQNRLVPQSKTWQNERLVYTHGFGVCGNPVNIFTSEGLPDYWVKDIPPVSKYKELQIDQPRIYFGEKTNTHVYVKTKLPEFDYPKGDQNATYTYDGPGGVILGSGLRKFAFAWRFDGIRMLTSKEITADSRIMFRRNLQSRVEALAPFLMYDQDPYQVIADGSLWFMWDAYTSTDHFPYSEPHGEFNYIRNSVKVVMNTFTGKVDFYIFDESDPVIKTYQNIFPNMFKHASAMPEKLKQQIRYPEDFLKIQGEVYSTYHMNDPVVFYNKEDAWQIAKESSHGKVHYVLPYYIVMTLPGEKGEEFVQILPFTPLTTDEKNPRNNMVSWLAGRCDGGNYGQVVLYKFPKERLVYGPLQIGIRMNQDDIISKDFTLWNQQGSKVIPGNLLVIPLSDFRILYLQPIYLQAEVGKMPELKRVVIALGDKLAYGASFEDALGQLLGKSVKVVSTTVPGQKLSTKDLMKAAKHHLEQYRQLTGQGKFVEAGKEMEQLSHIVNELLKD